MNITTFTASLIARAREGARTAPGCSFPAPAAVSGRFDAWSVMLDCFRHDGIEHWTLSIQLMTPSSTVRDWEIQGRIVGALITGTGYPQDAPLVEPVIPIAETHPTATLWWAWHNDGSAIDESVARTFRQVISAVTPRDPQRKGARS